MQTNQQNNKKQNKKSEITVIKKPEEFLRVLMNQKLESNEISYSHYRVRCLHLLP